MGYIQLESENKLDNDTKLIVNKLNKNKARLLADCMRLNDYDVNNYITKNRLLDKINRLDRTIKFLNGYN